MIELLTMLDSLDHRQRQLPKPATRRTTGARATLLVALLTLLSAAAPAQTAPGTTEAKPYDDRLFRLSEVLGAVHYLRELCGANEGQYWRERMRELMDAEGSTALRRARLTRAFNQRYRSYSRTYITCSASAQTAITRFLGEGSELADGLLKSFP